MSGRISLTSRLAKAAWRLSRMLRVQASQSCVLVRGDVFGSQLLAERAMQFPHLAAHRLDVDAFLNSSIIV